VRWRPAAAKFVLVVGQAPPPRVENELPLLIDLLRLLQGVGFRWTRACRRWATSCAMRCRCWAATAGRQRGVHPRPHARAVLRRLSEVYADDDLTSLMQLILQVHAHGGAVQEPLRQFSIRLREQRRNTLKEKVGKLSVKMTVVMMLTLLPALMLVLAGPALVALATTMSKMGSP
jgi:tight adherence protein C